MAPLPTTKKQESESTLQYNGRVTGEWNMRLGWTLLILFAVTNSTAQTNYSVWTMEGAWLMHQSPIYPYKDSLNYLVFDGEGKITEGSMFPAPVTGTYAVTKEGALTGTMQVGKSTLPLAGQLTSKREVAMGVWKMFKVTNMGTLGPYLSGTLSTEKCGEREVTLMVSGSGQMTGLRGDLYPPLTGRLLADSGVFIGHLTTQDTSEPWQEFSLWGYMKGDTLQGKVGLDAAPGACGSSKATLLRSSSVGIARKIRSRWKAGSLEPVRWFNLTGREVPSKVGPDFRLTR